MAIKKTTKSGRGGPHNSGLRESTSLSCKQVNNLIEATIYADLLALPFTRMITIHWEAAGIQLLNMSWATYRYTNLLAKTLARHGSQTSWVWVHEGGPDKGGHCHLLVHVPAALVSVVMRLQKKWLRAITGQPYRKRAIHSKPIGGRLGIELSNPNLHAVNVDNALSYLLKGANDSAAKEFGLSRLEPGGRIIGKRCGTSQNLGITARTRKMSSHRAGEKIGPHLASPR